jgi:hypothetical protein
MSIVFPIFLVGSAFGQHVLSLGELAKYDIMKRDNAAQKEMAKKNFSLRDARVQDFLSRIMQAPTMERPLSPEGFVAVLYSHGPHGFLWALSQLPGPDDAIVLSRVSSVLDFFEYRETYLFYICLLDDKRLAPDPQTDYHSRMDPNFIPSRICDVAFSHLSYKLRQHGEAPESLKGKPFGNPIEDRDECIRILKAWWAKEGERLITATRPSVVEVLLKESEEKAKEPAQKPKGPDKPQAEKKALVLTCITI